MGNHPLEGEKSKWAKTVVAVAPELIVHWPQIKYQIKKKQNKTKQENYKRFAA